MLITLTGGPFGGHELEVAEGVTEFAINTSSSPVYSADGSFLGYDLAFAGAKLTAVDEHAELRAELWEQIKAIRDRLQANGVKVGNHWFHSDLSSKIQQLGLVMMGAGIPAGLKWKTMSGEQITMTQQLAGQIFGAQAAHDMTLFGVAESLKASMNTMQDPTSFNVNQGWPETYEV